MTPIRKHKKEVLLSCGLCGKAIAKDDFYREESGRGMFDHYHSPQCTGFMLSRYSFYRVPRITADELRIARQEWDEVQGRLGIYLGPLVLS